MILYHGTATHLAPEPGGYLLPPAETGVEPHHERGRRERGLVYLTADPGYARIYAGRACSAAGGRPVVVRAWVPDSVVAVLSTAPGRSVYAAPAARVIERS